MNIVKQTFFVLVSIAFVMQPSFFVQASGLKILNHSDYEQLVQQQQKPFLMMFWSVDCAPCLKKMNQIAHLPAEQRLNTIFISTDGHELMNEVSESLASMNLQSENNWVLNSDQLQQIISTVDKHWYGETPRSYYFDTSNRRTLIK